MKGPNIERLVRLHAHLKERQSYLIEYNRDHNIQHTGESYRAYKRLFGGYVHFEAKLEFLIAEMEEFLFLGGDLK